MFDWLVSYIPFSWPETVADEIARLERELELARKKGPPPRQWDGRKKLPWPVNIYYKGQRYENVEEYDLDNHTFKANGIRYYSSPFLVQRLH